MYRHDWLRPLSLEFASEVDVPGGPPFCVLVPRNPHLRQSVALLGGSWVVISGVVNRVTVVTTRIKGAYDPTSSYP